MIKLEFPRNCGKPHHYKWVGLQTTPPQCGSVPQFYPSPGSRSMQGNLSCLHSLWSFLEYTMLDSLAY